jgi:hypothetical protein
VYVNDFLFPPPQVAPEPDVPADLEGLPTAAANGEVVEQGRKEFGF